jgi:hypothetical protein
MKKALKNFSSVMGADPKRLQAIREKARIAIAKGQAGYLTRLNRHAKSERYNRGDLVLRKQQHGKAKYPAKWSMRYVGPYVITEVINPVVMRIKDEATGWSDLVHTSFLRPYRSPASPPCMEASENFGEEGETRIDFTPYEQVEEEEAVEDVEETYDSSDYEREAAVNWDADATFASESPSQTSGFGESSSTPRSGMERLEESSSTPTRHDETMISTPPYERRSATDAMETDNAYATSEYEVGDRTDYSVLDSPVRASAFTPASMLSSSPLSDDGRTESLIYGTPQSTPSSTGSPRDIAESPRTPILRKSPRNRESPSSRTPDNQGSLLARFGNWVAGAVPKRLSPTKSPEAIANIRERAAEQEALLQDDSAVAGFADPQPRKVSFIEPPPTEKAKPKKEPPLILRYVKERKKASEVSTRPRRTRAAPVDYATMEGKKESSTRYKQELATVADPEAEIIIYGYRDEKGREVAEHKLPSRARIVDGTLDTWTKRS